MENLRMAYVNAADMDAQVAFYSAVLGQAPIFRDGNKWAEFRLPKGGRFALSGPEESASIAKGAITVFETDRFEELIALLSSLGRPTSIRDMGDHGNVLTTTDAEGTPIQFFAKKTP